MEIIHMEERKMLNKIYKLGILLAVGIFSFVSLSSITLAVDYGSGLYNSGLYSSTTQSTTTTPPTAETYTEIPSSSSRSGSYYTPWMVKQTVPSAASTPSATVTSIKLTKGIKLGQSNNQIKILQKFLNDNGFIIAKKGAGSPGKETSYFGTLTKKAVIKFQEKYSKDILKPYGLKKGNGIVGPKTREMINEIMEGGLE